MPKPKSVICAGSSTLAELQTTVQQQEQVLGPLIKLDNNGRDSVLTFDTDEDPPQNLAVLVPTGSPAPGSSYKVICKGTCIVSGKKTNITAYRQA